jgi:hypothetical protein
MKNKIQTFLMALITFGAIHDAAAPGTAFTYQGRLNDSGQCANGQFDLQFQLYGSASGGTPLAANTTTTSNVLVTNGLFTASECFLKTRMASPKFNQNAASKKTSISRFVDSFSAEISH